MDSEFLAGFFSHCVLKRGLMGRPMARTQRIPLHSRRRTAGGVEGEVKRGKSARVEARPSQQAVNRLTAPVVGIGAVLGVVVAVVVAVLVDVQRA